MATVSLEVEGSVATLTLNRPERLNAFTREMHGDLRRALDQLEAAPALRVLILSGAGRGFCAGQDLEERAAAFHRGDIPDLGESLDQNYNPLIRRLMALPFPVIAAVNGIASGAGVSLALACDIVIVAASARFQLSFSKVGLGPDAGASWLLPHTLGLGRALSLALLGDAIDAQEALCIGMVAQVVDDRTLMVRANEIATMLASRPPGALRAIKRRMRSGAGETLDAALDAERDTQSELGRHPHYREAVLAFAEKRPPLFD